MPDHEDLPCRYFAKAGTKNTEALLDAVVRRTKELSISKVVIATSSGSTAIAAAKKLGSGMKITAVTHVAGFSKPNEQELTDVNRKELESLGVAVFTGQHAFGGVGRAVRNKLSTYQLDEIMAYTLRTFGQGVKVAIEIALMAADAGLVRTDEDVISIGGSGAGADSALVLQPANSNRFFDIKIREIIAKPRNF